MVSANQAPMMPRQVETFKQLKCRQCSQHDQSQEDLQKSTLILFVVVDTVLVIIYIIHNFEDFFADFDVVFFAITIKTSLDESSDWRGYAGAEVSDFVPV